MRKLKLQIQISVDDFIGSTGEGMDWMTWNRDDEIKNYVNELTDSVNTILVGCKMTDGFVSHRENVLKNKEDESHPFAKKMVEKPKVVFTKTLAKSTWINTTLAKGNIVDEIHKLKSKAGSDILVYFMIK